MYSGFERVSGPARCLPVGGLYYCPSVLYTPLSVPIVRIFYLPQRKRIWLEDSAKDHLSIKVYSKRTRICCVISICTDAKSLGSSDRPDSTLTVNGTRIQCSVDLAMVHVRYLII